MNPIDRGTARYMETTSSFSLLSREDEAALWLLVREKGDRQAVERLVQAHLRDVTFIAKKHRLYGVPLADLIAEGNLGLLHAFDKFDPARGVRFGTYAAHWVRAYIVTHVLRSWSLVGGSSGVLRSGLFFRLRRERARLETLHGSGEETMRLLAERMAVSEDQLRLMLERLDARDLSLDAPLYSESTTTIADRLASGDDTERSYDEGCERRKVETALYDALDVLDRRERFIAEARWLADAESELSLADIGRELGVSRERARQLETRARAKMKKALAERWGSSESTGAAA
ncbi:MAG: sigma-70 family RNA polymerase sigma factor [Polyangiaceae bacterium]